MILSNMCITEKGFFFRPVCVCVCVCDRERKRARRKEKLYYLCWSTPLPVGFCTALCSSCWLGYIPPGTGRHLHTSLHHTHTSHSHSSRGLKGNTTHHMLFIYAEQHAHCQCLKGHTYSKCYL